MTTNAPFKHVVGALTAQAEACEAKAVELRALAARLSLHADGRVVSRDTTKTRRRRRRRARKPTASPAKRIGRPSTAVDDAQRRAKKREAMRVYRQQLKGRGCREVWKVRHCKS